MTGSPSTDDYGQRRADRREDATCPGLEEGASAPRLGVLEAFAWTETTLPEAELDEYGAAPPRDFPWEAAKHTAMSDGEALVTTCRTTRTR
jgi:hypothetical protein